MIMSVKLSGTVTFDRIFFVSMVAMVGCYFVIQIMPNSILTELEIIASFSQHLPIVSFVLDSNATGNTSIAAPKIIITTALFVLIFCLSSLVQFKTALLSVSHKTGLLSVSQKLPFLVTVQSFWILLAFNIVGYAIVFYPKLINTGTLLSDAVLYSDLRYVAFIGWTFFANSLFFMLGVVARNTHKKLGGDNG